MQTYENIMTRHDVEIPEHLVADAVIPILDGPQRQGDLIILPTRPGAGESVPVPAEGVPVIRGENGGNTHLLVADGDVSWQATPGADANLGVFTVAKNAIAYLLHPEHGGQAFAPGSYRIRRQREQADEIRLVAD